MLDELYPLRLIILHSSKGLANEIAWVEALCCNSASCPSQGLDREQPGGGQANQSDGVSCVILRASQSPLKVTLRPAIDAEGCSMPLHPIA